jgi:hypothetical protein
MVDVELTGNPFERSVGPGRHRFGSIQCYRGAASDAFGVGDNRRQLAEVDVGFVSGQCEGVDVMQPFCDVLVRGSVEEPAVLERHAGRGQTVLLTGKMQDAVLLDELHLSLGPGHVDQWQKLENREVAQGDPQVSQGAAHSVALHGSVEPSWKFGEGRAALFASTRKEGLN